MRDPRAALCVGGGYSQWEYLKGGSGDDRVGWRQFGARAGFGCGERKVGAMARMTRPTVRPEEEPWPPAPWPPLSWPISDLLGWLWPQPPFVGPPVPPVPEPEGRPPEPEPPAPFLFPHCPPPGDWFEVQPGVWLCPCSGVWIDFNTNTQGQLPESERPTMCRPGWGTPVGPAITSPYPGDPEPEPEPEEPEPVVVVVSSDPFEAKAAQLPLKAIAGGWPCFGGIRGEMQEVEIDGKPCWRVLITISIHPDCGGGDLPQLSFVTCKGDVLGGDRVFGAGETSLPTGPSADTMLGAAERPIRIRVGWTNEGNWRDGIKLIVEWQNRDGSWSEVTTVVMGPK